VLIVVDVCLIDWVKLVRPNRHKTGHFGDTLRLAVLAYYWKKN